MLKETIEFIKLNKDLINAAEWDQLYDKFNHQYKVRGFLNLPMMIDLTRAFLECGINLNLPNNYSITEMKRDINILQKLNIEDFTEPEDDDENAWCYLCDLEKGMALTNILRASRVISQNEYIPGDGDYHNLRICIPGVYEEEVKKDIDSHNYGNYWFEINIQVDSNYGDFLSDWAAPNSLSFNLKHYGSDIYYIKEDDKFYDNMDNSLKLWLKELLSL